MLVNYWVQRGYESVNRRDFELALASQDPEVVIRVEAEQSGFTLYTFRAEKVVRQDFFFDRAQAEEAAGLSG